MREQFGVRWTALAMLALLIANIGVTVTEFLSIAAAVQVLANNPQTRVQHYCLGDGYCNHCFSCTVTTNCNIQYYTLGK